MDNKITILWRQRLMKLDIKEGTQQKFYSERLEREVRFYIFHKENIPIVILHDHEREILKDHDLHKLTRSDIINYLTKDL